MNNNDFLEPVPKWVTYYGFILLVLLVLSVVVFSAKFKIPQTISTSIVVEEMTPYLKIDFEKYVVMKDYDSIVLRISNNKEIIPVRILSEKIIYQEDNILIPINVIDKNSLSKVLSINPRERVDVIVNSSPLIYKLFNKRL